MNQHPVDPRGSAHQTGKFLEEHVEFLGKPLRDDQQTGDLEEGGGGGREVGFDRVLKREDVIVGYGENRKQVAMDGTCQGSEEDERFVEFLEKVRGRILRSLGSRVNDANRREYRAAASL